MVGHVGQISINVRAIFSPRLCFPIFFPFYLPLIPPSSPPSSLSLFFSNHDREKRFVRTNDAQWSTCGARLFVERRNLNREPRLPRGALLRVYFQRPRISTPRFSSARASSGGEEGRRKTVKSKHHVLHHDHVETCAVAA